MENNNKKIITMSFMVAGILAGITAKVLIYTASQMVSGKLVSVLASDLVQHGLPVAIGAIVFAVLQMNKTVCNWADEVVAELSRIVWPSRKDTTAMTIVVCIMLVISGLMIGGFDIISAYAIDALLNLHLSI